MGKSRTQLRRDAILLIILLLYALSGWASGVAANAADRHPLSVDDILRMEDVGRVAILGSGKSIVYEWIPPYEQAPNLDVLENTADRSPMAQLRTVDLQAPASPRPLFEQDSRSGYWIGGLSPDGSKLAIYTLRSGELKAGVYDVSQQRLTLFSFTPNYSTVVQRPLWISNDELIYAALPPGKRPSILQRSGLAAELNDRWRKTFQGVEPSFTRLRSTRAGTEAADEFRDGMLVRVHAGTGETRELSRGYFYNLRLSHGARYVAGLKEGGYVQLLSMQRGDGLPPARKQLVVVDLHNGREAVPCDRCNVLPATLRWSGDDSRLTFFAREVGLGVEDAEPHEYLPATNALAKVDIGDLQPACGSPIGTQFRAIGFANGVAIYGRLGTEAEPVPELGRLHCNRRARQDWFLLRGDRKPVNLTSSLSQVSGDLLGVTGRALYVLASGRVWRLNAGEAAASITPTGTALSPWDVGFRAAMRSSETLYTGSDALPSRMALESDDGVMVVNPLTGGVAAISKAEGTQLLAVTDNGELAVLRQDLDTGSKLLLARKRQPLSTLLEFNQHKRAIVSARTAEITYKVGDHSELTSCLLLPHDYAAERRYPLIVYAYPDVRGDCDFASLAKVDTFNTQLFTARGYAVLFVATPRSLIRTPEGATRGLTPVVLAGVDEAVRAGYADPDRIGVFGFSQGHHVALQLLTETTRFRAAVVMYGITDAASHYGSTALSARLSPDGFPVGNAGRYESERSDNWVGVPPWEDPMRYVRNSPVFFADRIQTPVLILHSDFDPFPLGQSEEIFTALYRLRKEAEYVTYWGEGHSNLSPANIRDAWARKLEWFDRYLAAPASAATN